MAGLRPATLLAAVALALVAAPAAYGDAFEDIFRDYQRDGQIDACRYSEQDLKDAKGQVPNDIEAYAPDFPAALEAAAERRAGGGCRKPPAVAAQTTPATAAPGATTPTPPAGAGTPAASATATGTPSPQADPQPAKAVADDAIARAAQTTRSSDAGTPAALVLLAAMGALLALGGLGYAAGRWLAWDPAWARGSRHAMGEAGWRASATWAEFADWVRIGR